MAKFADIPMKNPKTKIYKINRSYRRDRIIVSIFMIYVVISLASTVSGRNLPQNAMAEEPAAAKSMQCVTNTGKPQLLSTTSNQTLSVRGIIDLTRSTIKLYPFMILPGSKYTERPTNSSFSINLLDGKGRTLAHYPFEPKMITNTSQSKDKTGILSEAVPYILCTKEIVISKDNKPLASRNVDDYAPKARIIFPIGGETFPLAGNLTVKWQGSDPDGDNLTYFLLYSTDAGRSWQTIASDIKATHLTINMGALPGSNIALFRIIATDGVNTAISDSNSTFSVPSTSNVGG